MIRVASTAWFAPLSIQLNTSFVLAPRPRATIKSVRRTGVLKEAFMAIRNQFIQKRFRLHDPLVAVLAVLALFPSMLQRTPVRAAHESPRSVSLSRSSTTAPAPHVKTNGKIAFGSKRDGNNEIYVMDANGGNQTRITNNFDYDDQPHWSPDGTKIAFFSRRDGNFELYSMNADGSNQTRLTNDFAADGFPAWSPDGAKIVFMSGNSLFDPNSFEIYVMDD